MDCSFPPAWMLKAFTDVLFTRPHLCCWKTVQTCRMTLVQVTKVTFRVTVVFLLKRTSIHALCPWMRGGLCCQRSEVSLLALSSPRVLNARPLPQLPVPQSHPGPCGIPDSEWLPTLSGVETLRAGTRSLGAAGSASPPEGSQLTLLDSSGFMQRTEFFKCFYFHLYLCGNQLLSYSKLSSVARSSEAGKQAMSQRLRLWVKPENRVWGFCLFVLIVICMGRSTLCPPLPKQKTIRPAFLTLLPVYLICSFN